MSCQWIEGDDFAERLHRGEAIYCGAKVRRAGEPYCPTHRARAYLPPRLDPQRPPAELTLEQGERCGEQRRGGLPFSKAIDLAA